MSLHSLSILACTYQFQVLSIQNWTLSSRGTRQAPWQTGACPSWRIKLCRAWGHNNRLEVTPKCWAKLSHGDSRRFFYRATANSMPKTKKPTRNGWNPFLFQIKAQFRLQDSVFREENLSDFWHRGVRKATAQKHVTHHWRGAKQGPKRKRAKSKTRSRLRPEDSVCVDVIRFFHIADFEITALIPHHDIFW